MNELYAITLCIGGIAWIHQHLYWRLYQKTSGHAAPKRSSNQSIGVIVGTGCAMGCAMLGSAPWALGTWALSTASIVAVLIPGRKVEDVLHAESAQHLEQRLGFLKSQLDRLEERNRLDSVLNRVAHSESALGKITERFELILATIENHLLMGDHAHAERIITVFARHLRQTLYEGSMPFLHLSETIEHIQTHFDLMHLLTGKRISCDIGDGMLDDLTRSRHTETFLLGTGRSAHCGPISNWQNEASNPSETPSSKWTFLAMNSLFASPLPSPCTYLKAATTSTSNTASNCSVTRVQHKPESPAGLKRRCMLNDWWAPFTNGQTRPPRPTAIRFAPRFAYCVPSRRLLTVRRHRPS